MKVVVAMSGGVDSSVAALILQERGFEVIGVSMQLWDYGEAEESAALDTGGSCCSLDDLTDARRVADKLGIPFYLLNMEKVFSKEVVDYFVDSYLSGETPNPCTRCNQILKFDVLLRKARELGVDRLATGHYARVVKPDEGGGYRLLKGVDPQKDQSYFLFTMNQSELASVLFPLGGMTKEEVRAYARKHGIRTADKEESQEICFIPDNDYGGFIADRMPLSNGESEQGSGGGLGSPGDIVDSSGVKLGSHRGLYRYTIGQRKGLNIGGAGGPYYVTGIDTTSKILVVGPSEELYSSGLTARDVSWINNAPLSEEKITAMTRYRHPGSECVVTETGSKSVKVSFTNPEKAVTPGQAVVFYRYDEVLGGGWISGAVK